MILEMRVGLQHLKNISLDKRFWLTLGDIPVLICSSLSALTIGRESRM